MSATDSIFQMYQRFYAQKGVLTEAPTLSIDTNKIGIADFPRERALMEMNAVASYLMGHRDASKIPFKEKISIIRNAYDNQPFWKELLLDYLDMTLDVEEERLDKEDKELYQEMQEAVDELNEVEAHKNGIVEQFGQKIEEAKFHVDGRNLVRNFLKMVKRDAKEAKSVLESHPAYFSPIITKDKDGKTILSPSQAMEEDAKLAKFLKTLKC